MEIVLNGRLTGRLATVLLLVLTAPAVARTATTAGDPGQRLYSGAQPLTARLAGHSEALPPSATLCGNCHDLRPGQPSPSAIGPLLNGRSLLEARSRRAGPPSRFDAASFCRLLRDGIDPVQVTLRPVMPRYELSDVQCTALWSFLVKQ